MDWILKYIKTYLLNEKGTKENTKINIKVVKLGIRMAYELSSTKQIQKIVKYSHHLPVKY